MAASRSSTSPRKDSASSPRKGSAFKLSARSPGTHGAFSMEEKVGSGEGSKEEAAPKGDLEDFEVTLSRTAVGLANKEVGSRKSGNSNKSFGFHVNVMGRVSYVVPGGPADRAGLQAWDRIKTVDGQATSKGAVADLVSAPGHSTRPRVSAMDGAPDHTETPHPGCTWP